MKPNTILHAFFDGDNVDVHCAPGNLSGSTTYAEGLEHTIVNQNGNFGDQLVSDANGFVCGLFRIPESTFRTGDRTFMLTNVDDLSTGTDARITLGKSTFTADNVSVTKGSSTINVRQPLLSHESTTQQRITTSSFSFNIFLANEVFMEFINIEDLILVQETQFDLSPGQSKQVPLRFFALSDKIPGIYLGKIIIKSESTTKIINAAYHRCAAFLCLQLEGRSF